MAMQRFMNPRLPVMLTGSLIALYACSFQDFAHLQGGAGEGSAGLGNGGTSGSGGVTGRGGDAGNGGSAAGLIEPGAGSSGDEAGRGGEGGEGAQPEGGEAGAAEAPKGGSKATGGAGAGGTSATGGGAGEQNETGGTAGLGGLGGTSGTSGTSGMGGMGGNPPLVGNLLVNGGFQSGLLGWTVDPATATTNRHAYTQTPNPPNGTSSSLATWHQTQAYTVTISQTVSGLEPGNYTFRALVSTQQTQEAYLFARNCGGEEIQLPIPLISFEWQPYEIPVPVTWTSCEVGIFVDNVPEDWVNADEFSFEKDP